MTGGSSSVDSRDILTNPGLSNPIERISTGITDLDTMLGGGFPSGTFNCVQGDIGTGTSTFCLQAIWSRLTTGGLASFMCFDDRPETVIEHFKSFGWDVKPYIETKHLLVYDAQDLLNSLASVSEGQNGIAEKKVLLSKFLNDYTKETCAIQRSLPRVPSPAVSAVDSFSSIAPYVDVKSAYVLAHMIADSARRHNNLFLTVAHIGAIEANVVCACNTVADGILRLAYRLVRNTLKRVMRVEKMVFTPMPSKEFEYIITSKNGIELKGEDRANGKAVGNGYNVNGVRLRAANKSMPR